MEKIELNKRTLRTLSMSEIELVGGAVALDGDEDPDGGKDKTKTEPDLPPPPTPPCPLPSEVCPATADRKCCPNSGD